MTRLKLLAKLTYFPDVKREMRRALTGSPARYSIWKLILMNALKLGREEGEKKKQQYHSGKWELLKPMNYVEKAKLFFP